MKKCLLLLTFLGVIALVNVNAQCHGAKTAQTESKVSTQAGAAKAAALDNSVEERINAQTGEVTYVRKSVCPTTGKVSFATVEYCSKSGKFVNVSSSEKSSCTKRAGATKVSNTEKTSCCASAGKAQASASQKACCSKAKAKSEAVQQKTSVKLVKTNNN